MFAVSIKRTADCLIGWLLAQVSETARKFSSNVMYIFNHQHRETTTDKKKQVYKDTHRHNYTQAGVCLGTRNSTGALSCLHVPVCSVTLPAHLSAMLFGLRSIWCLTYNKFPPVRLSMLFFSFCPSVCAFLSAYQHLYAPNRFTYQRYFSFCTPNRKTSLHLTLRLIRWGWVQEREFSTLLSLFHSSFCLLYLCVSSIFPHFLPSFPLYLKNKSLCTSLPASHLSHSSLPSPCLYCPPTACSHSHSEYVSRKYYHTKWKGEFFFFLLFSFHSTLRYLLSLPAC